LPPPFVTVWQVWQIPKAVWPFFASPAVAGLTMKRRENTNQAARRIVVSAVVSITIA
jgi:hypothetical protein